MDPHATMIIGHVERIFRYPIKSMAGEALPAAQLGWHGIEGDRRFAFRRTGDRGGFPWLTATKVPELLRYKPIHQEADTRTDLPTRVRTPAGRELDLFGEELAAEVGARHGTPVEMTQLRSGVFDEAPLSLITIGTIREIGRLAGTAAETDVRRFRPNLVIRTEDPTPFEEDRWVGAMLSFGEPHDTAPCVSVTMRDERCSMVNLDPDSAVANADVLKAVVRANGNNAGVYATVIRTGELAIGQAVYLRTMAPPSATR